MKDFLVKSRLVFILSAVFLLMAAGFVVFRQTHNDIPGVFPNPTSYGVMMVNDDGGSDVDGAQVDTSTWEAYQNKDYGFTFKYPKNWIWREQDGLHNDKKYLNVFFSESDGKHGEELVVGIRSLERNNAMSYSLPADFLDWHRLEMESNEIVAIDSGEVDNLKVIKTKEADGIDSIGSYVYFFKDNFVIYFRAEKEMPPKFDGIFSSLIFDK